MADTTVAAPLVTFKKRATKSTVRKRVATPPPASDSDSDLTSSEDEAGRQIKRRKKMAAVTATTTTSTNLSGTRRTHAKLPTDPDSVSTKIVHPQSNADNATKRSDWFDEDHDGSQLLHQSTSTNVQSEGVYHGMAAYKSYIKNPANHEPAAEQSKPNRIGPQKLNSNVRSITVTDFAPDVCKDYKQTGFCGFGDSCKFLHAREDYKQGWQLDRDWEVNTKGKTPGGRTVASAAMAKADRANNHTRSAGGGTNESNEDDEKLLESIPFACIICKNGYSNPIVTKCGHYFCESCALKRYARNASCAACGAGTGGVFNVAKKLNGLLERKKEREAKKVDSTKATD